MRVLLVDDEPAALERLQALFEQIAGAEVVGVARNGREAMEQIDALKPDLAMLDIQMPELSGLSVAGGLPADERPEIVFVTAFEMYAADAFDVEAADYLLKPVRFDRLRQAVERARRRRAMRDAAPPIEAAASAEAVSFWVSGRNGHVRVLASDLDWIEAARDYVMLHTPTRSYIHRLTMTALEEMLDPEMLTRVHRSAFVNLTRVQEVQRLGKGLISLILRDGVNVAVGPTYVKAVLARLGLSAG
ncbi:LytTR family DNA-binding domain-containing protein [Phenylobacterium sp.]|uniref:LytR/AlgR family response regulator transcription factor n=1 Tax=Phenylobacterium sp. TaxID=1871053 RepID=UPI0025FC952D|nr:LytTR family DNA-binding domain-containing protein [Phenylobacterium sp.]